MKCCICGKEITGYGNNPDPVHVEFNNDGMGNIISYRCCDECNQVYVIPARLHQWDTTDKHLF